MFTQTITIWEQTTDCVWIHFHNTYRKCKESIRTTHTCENWAERSWPMSAQEAALWQRYQLNTEVLFFCFHWIFINLIIKQVKLTLSAHLQITFKHYFSTCHSALQRVKPNQKIVGNVICVSSCPYLSLCERHETERNVVVWKCTDYFMLFQTYTNNV